MKSIALRRWSRLQFKDPTALLTALRPLQIAVAASALPPKTKALRGSKQKTHREIWQTALFSHGMSVALALPSLEFAIIEEDDYDCVVRWTDEEGEHYVPVQLKEVVPGDLNQTATIESEIAKLTKYTSSPELVVALFLNRAGRFDLSRIKVPSLTISQLWMFGNRTLDQSRWMLYGDMLSSSSLYEFDFPNAKPNHHGDK